MQFNNPAFGQGLQSLGSALFGNPGAEGRARLAKSKTDRQNQETVNREQLKQKIINARARGTDPRQTQANIYGHSVAIGDNAMGLAPEFGRGVGMGVYGTDEIGMRQAADLAMGAGGAFQNTELGTRAAMAAQAAQAAASRRAAMEQARFEANQPTVMDEGQLLVSPEGDVMLHAAPSEVLGETERQTSMGPNGELVNANPNQELMGARIEQMLGEAALANAQANAAGMTTLDPDQRLVVPGKDSVPTVGVGAAPGVIDSQNQARWGEFLANTAGANLDSQEAYELEQRSRYLDENPSMMGDLIAGGDPGNGSGDTRDAVDALRWNQGGALFAREALNLMVARGDLPEFNNVTPNAESAIRQKATEIQGSANGPSEIGPAVQQAIAELTASGQIRSDGRTLDYAPSASGGGSPSGSVGGVNYRIVDPDR